jgi:hypothetical protein
VLYKAGINGNNVESKPACGKAPPGLLYCLPGQSHSKVYAIVDLVLQILELLRKTIQKSAETGTEYYYCIKWLKCIYRQR